MTRVSYSYLEEDNLVMSYDYFFDKGFSYGEKDHKIFVKTLYCLKELNKKVLVFNYLRTSFE